MSNFGGSKVTAEELTVTSLLEFKILQAAGETTLEDVVLVGDEFVTNDDGDLVRASA